MLTVGDRPFISSGVCLALGTLPRGHFYLWSGPTRIACSSSGDREMNLGAQFEISVDGTMRSHRDRQDYAIEAGGLLKQRHPQRQVVVRDGRVASLEPSGTHGGLR